MHAAVFLGEKKEKRWEGEVREKEEEKEGNTERGREEGKQEGPIHTKGN